MIDLIDLTQDVRRELHIRRRAPVLRGFRYGVAVGFALAITLGGFLTWLTH